MSEAESPDAPIQTRDAEQPESDPADIDWVDVWGIADVEPDTGLSPTQAALCVQLHDACPPGDDGGARDFLEAAADAGELERERTLASTEGDEPFLIIRCYRVAEDSA